MKDDDGIDEVLFADAMTTMRELPPAARVAAASMLAARLLEAAGREAAQDLFPEHVPAFVLLTTEVERLALTRRADRAP